MTQNCSGYWLKHPLAASGIGRFEVADVPGEVWVLLRVVLWMFMIEFSCLFVPGPSNIEHYRTMGVSSFSKGQIPVLIIFDLSIFLHRKSGIVRMVQVQPVLQHRCNSQKRVGTRRALGRGDKGWFFGPGGPGGPGSVSHGLPWSLNPQISPWLPWSKLRVPKNS